jgi:hypothetical protein
MYSSPKIYPIRTSANNWFIKFWSKHICSKDCQLAMVEETDVADNRIIYFIDNPDYDHHSEKCAFFEKINETIINIKDFDEQTLLTTDGFLVYENQIVIPDQEIYFQISFPLHSKRNILVEPIIQSGIQRQSPRRKTYTTIHLHLTGLQNSILTCAGQSSARRHKLPNWPH